MTSTLNNIIDAIVPLSPIDAAHTQQFKDIMERAATQDPKFAEELMLRLSEMPYAAGWKECAKGRLTQAIEMLDEGEGWAGVIEALRTAMDGVWGKEEYCVAAR